MIAKQTITAILRGWLPGGRVCRIATLAGEKLRQGLLLALLALGFASTAQAAIPPSERAVLDALYASTNGAGWTNKTGWGGAPGTECTWYGVTCDATQSNVTAIYLGNDLVGNNLVGTLPSISGLTALQSFYAENNQLTGSIPSLSGLTALQGFGVSDNQLTGFIPSLSGLTALKYFRGDNNQLTGPIPSLSGLTALRSFSVNSNQLTGAIPSLSGLTALQYFGVWYNRLTGSIPSLSGLTALQSFYAHNNQLTGSIPSLSGLMALQTFFVGNNQLTGSIPPLSGLMALQAFSVRGNQLTGSIPSLSGLTALRSFSVSDNQLTGSIPSLSGLTALRSFSVSDNQLTGSIPPLSGLTALQDFSVGDNQLTGSIPSLSGLTALQGFFVGGNQLTGPVPAAPASLLARGSILCANYLVSSGNPAIDAAWATATGVDWLACQTPTPTLTVTRSGSGSGSIASSPTGINCGTDCWEDYAPGTTVTLTATPASGSYFVGWSGDCTGAGSCSVTMNAARNVTATFKLKPFAATTTSFGTPTSATITATISFNPSDMGKQGSVFVNAWVPVNGLSALGISTELNSALNVTSTQDNPFTSKSMQATMAPLAATGPGSFVLVQLTPSGWRLVVDGQLIPYTSGVLGDQLAALTILNNTNTTGLAGSLFCLGYGESVEAMIATGKMMPIGTLNSQNMFSSTSEGTCNITQNYSDSWWNAKESGWGITITDHDTNAFVQWYTYDQSGHNQKYVIPGGTFSNNKCQFSGRLQHVTGPSWTLPAFDPSLVTRRYAGSGIFDFCPPDLPAGTIVFKYTADGVSGSKQLTRLPFGNDIPRRGGTANTGASDFTDLWWNPSESGWGVSVTQHGNNIFFRIFVYDTDGRPLLFVVPGVTFNSASSFTGALQLTTGPWFGSNPFDPNQVVRTTAGSATLTFSDANNGVLSYTVNGVTKTKSITRMAF